MTDEITTREALEILGCVEPSTISRYVHSGKLTPSRKLPWSTGPYLFWRTDVEQLAATPRQPGRPARVRTDWRVLADDLAATLTEFTSQAKYPKVEAVLARYREAKQR